MSKFLRKVKRILKSLIGKDFFIKEQIKVDKVMHGGENGYGGWDIYEEGLNANSIVYSFGVGEDASFDISIIKKFGVIVNAFDPTPKSIAWVKQQNFPSKFKMYEYGLADYDGSISFNPPENPEHVSHTILGRDETSKDSIDVKVKKLETILKELNHSHIDLLKMDIEGAEYQVIDSLIKSNIRPKQLLIEFHHRFPSVGINKSKNAIRQLSEIGYLIFSVSDSGEEYSFIHKI